MVGMVATIGHLTTIVMTRVRRRIPRVLVHVVRMSRRGPRTIAMVVVDMLARELIVAGRKGLSDDRVGSAGSSVGVLLLLLSTISTMLIDRRQLCLLPPQPQLRWLTGPETVAPHHGPRPHGLQLSVAHQRGLPAPYNGLHLLDVHGGDGAGVHHGLRSIGRGCSRLLTHQAGPLLGQTHKLVVARIEPGVHSVLKVTRSRNLRFLFLLGKHVESCVRLRDLEV